MNAEANGSSNYYIPIPKPPTSPAAPITATSAVKAPVRSDDDLMQVDDTRDRVYIHNLDDELADIESDEEKLVFLPDIEKRLSKIPKQLLQSRNHEDHEDHEGQELVLYSVPKSLTVDEGHDSVRKAIIESRQRAREKADEEARQHDMNCKYDQNHHAEPAETAHGYSTGYVEQDPDPDKMDMD